MCATMDGELPASAGQLSSRPLGVPLDASVLASPSVSLAGIEVNGLTPETMAV